MILLITRHGITDHNENGVIQGDNEGSVNQIGQTQVSALCNHLTKFNISQTYSSDIRRCKETAAPISQALNQDVTYTALLREKNNGDFVGKKHHEIDWNSLGGTFSSARPPKGENLLDVRRRARTFFNKILLEDSNSIILIISHGAFLKIFLGYLLKMSIENSIRKLHIDHCSLTCLEIKSSTDYKLKYINDTSFLNVI